LGGRPEVEGNTTPTQEQRRQGDKYMLRIMSRFQYVRDIMSKPVITTSPNTPLNLALGTMLQKRIHRMPVVDQSNPSKLIGIITERNLRLAADSPFLEESAQEVLEHLAKHTVGDIMRSSVVTVTEHAPIVEAAKIIRVSNVYVPLWCCLA